MVDLVTNAMTESDRDGAQSYVVFRLGGEGYALEVMRVQEVLDVQSITEVPGSPKCLLGVINLRGHVVPVYDLRIPFGLHAGSNLKRAPSVLIVETEQGNDSRVTGLDPGQRLVVRNAGGVAATSIRVSDGAWLPVL